MDRHEVATMTQSKAHEKLYIGTGNAFAPEKFGADGIAAFVKEGFSGTNADYNFVYKREHHEGVQVYEYIYNNASYPLPKGIEIEEIVDTALNELVNKGCRVIIMPPIRTKDCSNIKNEELIVQACKEWLSNGGAEKVEKLIIIDMVGQMEKRGY